MLPECKQSLTTFFALLKKLICALDLINVDLLRAQFG